MIERTMIVSTIKRSSVSLLAVVSLAAWPDLALAQDLVTIRNVSLAMAAEAATAAVEQCLQDGFRATATVVDGAGHIKSVMRADGAGPHTIDSSRRKAYTSLSVGGSTGELDTFLRERSPSSFGLRFVEQMLPLPGGLAIRAGDEVVGAIGVGGAPGGDKDERCARAGIEKIQSRLKPR
jgi:uncharacterized protein GlcG (DUF336 family)